MSGDATWRVPTLPGPALSRLICAGRTRDALERSRMSSAAETRRRQPDAAADDAGRDPHVRAAARAWSSSSRSSSTCTASRARSSCPHRTSTTCSRTARASPATRPATSASSPTTPTSSRCPDPASFTPLPWKPEVARLACDLYVDGEPWPYCPRTILRRQLDRATRARLRAEGRRRARVLPAAPRSRTGRSRSPTQLDTHGAALLRHARADAQPRLRRRRSPGTSTRSAGTTTPPTTRTPTASSSRTSPTPTRSPPATARCSSATWSRRSRRSAGSSRRSCPSRSRTSPATAATST